MLCSDFQALYADGAWLGGNDIDVEGEWRWVTSGDLVTWTTWGDTEPNGGTSENCVILYPAGDWNDWGCQHASALAVCEFACIGV